MMIRVFAAVSPGARLASQFGIREIAYTMTKIRLLFGTAVTALVLSVGAAHAVETFEHVGRIGEVSRVTNTLTVDGATYVLPETLEISVSNTGNSTRVRLGEGQLIEFSGRTAKDGRKIIEQITVLRVANEDRDRE